MSLPSAQPLDANGKLVVVGDGVMLSGTITTLTGNSALITLTDAYGNPGVTVTVSTYNIRASKAKF